MLDNVINILLITSGFGLIMAGLTILQVQWRRRRSSIWRIYDEAPEWKTTWSDEELEALNVGNGEWLAPRPLDHDERDAVDLPEPRHGDWIRSPTAAELEAEVDAQAKAFLDRYPRIEPK